MTQQESIARESLEMDVLIVGAGPSGLATALRLAQLIEQHNAEIDAGKRQGKKLSTEEIYLLENGTKTTGEWREGRLIDTSSETLGERRVRLSELEQLITKHEDRDAARS